MATSITTRAGKGSALTHNEVDANFNNLKTTADAALPLAGGTMTGDLVVGTAAKGVNFTANSAGAGMTSQLLNWYEQGTWTPSEATITLASAVGHYTRIGNMVTAWADMIWPSTADANNVVINGLPFTTANSEDARSAFITYCNAADLLSGTGSVLPLKNSTQSQLYKNDGNRATNASMSTAELRATWIYFV